MAEAIAVDLAAGLVRKLVSLATEEVIQAWNFHEDLETLRDRLEIIDSLLSDAYTKKLTMPTIQNWFNKLEVVAHVANVFMDELAYEVTRIKVENRHRLLDFFVPSKNNILYRFKVAHKIKTIQTSFDKIFEWAGDLGLQPWSHLHSVVQQREIRNTPPFEDESKIVGRVNDLSYLVDLVSKKHEEKLAVIAVVGMGGLGKTTLARMVYNKDIVINMFSKRMWVTVSDDFDFMKILNEMVVSLTSTNSVLENSDGLIKDLQKHLKDVKFLLILDDVWNTEPEKWENLMNSLLGVGGAEGSKILVTTRNQEVIDVMQCSDSHRVEQLSEEDSWALFKQRAFSHGGFLETKAFTALGRRMVKRCGGLPLAIKTLGGLLRSKKSEEEWLLIQNSETWKSKGILSSLRLSYDNLPSSLKQCFAYLSNLPKDSIICKDEMVHIWMSLGFLSPSRHNNLLMEEIGNGYFNILLWNSLLQEVERDRYDNITYCKMHDLVHDLAIDLSKHHSSTDHELNPMSKAIYLRFEGVSCIKPKTTKRNFERVQVLYADAHIIRDVLPYLNHLTSLVLEGNRNAQLPFTSSMRYLKYLDISSFGWGYRLPNDITRLYNLQTLKVWNLREIPEKFGNLINLRHLIFIGKHLTPSLMLVGIERLTCLQTLPYYKVSRNQNCLLGQLGGFKNLRGKLKLYGLNDVANMKEASKAKLYEKSNVQLLRLGWSKNEDVMEEDVMEGLEPHENLKELRIEYFTGKKFASWITMMTNLVKIKLKNCNRCKEFPSLGQLPKLREIRMHRMKNVKAVGSRRNEFSGSGIANTVTTMYPSLTKLILYSLPQLEEWLEPIGEDQSAVLGFPQLEVLEIKECPKLTMIPDSCFASLKILTIHDLGSSMLLESMRKNCRNLQDLHLSDISDEGENPFSSSNMDLIVEQLWRYNSPSLTSTKLYNCKGLTCLNLGVPLGKSEVRNCPDLTSFKLLKESGAVNLELGPFSEELDKFPWPFSSVLTFPNLTHLSLHGWDKAKSILPTEQIDNSLSSIFPVLTRLDIDNFTGVETLPDSLAELPSLTHLRIDNCCNLKGLPTFKISHCLQQLNVSRCPILKDQYRKGSGPGWFKIQHIPDVFGFGDKDY